jgi:hypothetical protein
LTGTQPIGTTTPTGTNPHRAALSLTGGCTGAGSPRAATRTPSDRQVRGRDGQLPERLLATDQAEWLVSTSQREDSDGEYCPSRSVRTDVLTPDRREVGMAMPRLKAKAARGAAAVLCLAGLGGSLAAVAVPTPAAAWSWSSTVTLNGTAKTYGGCITGLYLSASDGEHGWASLGGGCVGRSYSYTFHGVPGGSGLTVHWSLNYGLSASGSFGLARPRFGGSAGRNICNFSFGC